MQHLSFVYMVTQKNPLTFWSIGKSHFSVYSNNAKTFKEEQNVNFKDKQKMRPIEFQNKNVYQ